MRRWRGRAGPREGAKGRGEEEAHSVHMTRMEKPSLAETPRQPVGHSPVQMPGNLPPRTQSKPAPKRTVYSIVAAVVCTRPPTCHVFVTCKTQHLNRLGQLAVCQQLPG